MATDVQHPPSERAVHGNGHSKARIAAIVATLVVAVVGAAVVFTQVGNDEPTAESVTATLRVDGQPNGLAVGSDALWVALNDEPTGLGAKLERINLTSGAVEQSVPITGVLNETRRTGTSLWTERIGDWMDTKPGELIELDWTSGKILGRVPFDTTPSEFDFGAGSLWVVVGREPATLIRVDPATKKQVGEAIPVTAHRVIGLAFGEGAVWAAAAEDGMLVRIDPDSGHVDKVKVGEYPVGIVIAGGSVWVTNRSGGTVSRVDPTTMKVVDTIDAGTFPTWLAAAGGSVWVANQSDGTVTRIDERTGQTIGDPIKIASPFDKDAAAHIVAVDGNSVWVSSLTEKTLSRIDASR